MSLPTHLVTSTTLLPNKSLYGLDEITFLYASHPHVLRALTQTHMTREALDCRCVGLCTAASEALQLKVALFPQRGWRLSH